MFVKHKVWTSLLLIVLLSLTSTTLVSAQSGDVFLPIVGGGSESASPPQATGSHIVKPPLSDVYIVLMSADPVVAYEGGEIGYESTKPEGGSKLDPTSEAVQEYAAFLEQSHDAALEAVGINPADKLYSYKYALNGFAARMTAEQAKAMTDVPGVALVQRDQFRTAQTDNTPTFLGLTKPGAAWMRGYTGEGVIVGIIDTGIWPEHPSFADDGSYRRPPVGPLPCEFGNTAWNPADVPFTCNNKLLGARQFLNTYKAVVGLTRDEFDSARDDDGHGTHTASTTAGNARVRASIFGIPRGRISGIAPRAHIIAYKGLGVQGGFASDLAAAIDQAVADGVDVINYSIGGGASVTGADEIAFLFAADAGVFAAVSAGNSGPGPGTIGGPASAPWVTAVGASFHSRAFISEIRLSGPGDPPKGVWGGSVTRGISNYRLVDAEGIADAEGDTSGQCLNPFEPGTFQATDAVLCNRYDFGVARTERVANVQAGGGGAVLFHNVPSVNVTPTDNHPLPTVHMRYEVGQPLKEYLVAHPGEVRISFSQGEARYAPFDSRVNPNTMASFSSRGPNLAAPDIIKPDVTAPGHQILAGASPTHVNTAAQGELFQSIMGTSMSGPHVAGIFALIKQAHPLWTPAMARSALMTTAYQDVTMQDFVTPAGPFDMGAGHVNPGGRLRKGTLFDPGLVYDAGLLDYFGFLCEAGPEIFASAETTCGFLRAIGVPTDPSDLNLPSIGIADLLGSQTVVRTVLSVAKVEREAIPGELSAEGEEDIVEEGGWRTYTVSVEEPPGFTVEVTPSTLRLREGDSATYEITITNDGTAAIGEWSFGSLTWSTKGRLYEVYSPIAVRAVALASPTEIEGSGESGSASFDIQFGYTGPYTAAAYGLVPATITEDSVVQDPNQVFDPNDGFSDLHSFDLSGAAHFRIAIPPETAEADSDLDVYVFDPNGDLVAASFNPGTDEQIDISQPEDGTWTVYVHGWLTVGVDSDYDMYSWIISETPGGNLSIDSAPTSATQGESGTIEVSWSGAAAGQWHLGAVSHNRDGDVIGYTLVNVDNR